MYSKGPACTHCQTFLILREVPLPPRCGAGTLPEWGPLTDQLGQLLYGRFSHRKSWEGQGHIPRLYDCSVFDQPWRKGIQMSLTCLGKEGKEEEHEKDGQRKVLKVCFWAPFLLVWVSGMPGPCVLGYHVLSPNAVFFQSNGIIIIIVIIIFSFLDMFLSLIYGLFTSVLLNFPVIFLFISCS